MGEGGQVKGRRGALLSRLLLMCVAFERRERSIVYRVAKRIVDDVNNDNNCDPLTNGERRFLVDNVEDGHVIFDVGANRGTWTKLCLTVGKKVTVHSFEPSVTVFASLAENVQGSSVSLNNCGMGATAERAYLRLADGISELNSLYDRRGVSIGVKGHEPVVLTTVDFYCEANNIERIDLIKIDVEGHELEVLKGCDRMLREERIGLIQFEYGGCDIDSRVFLGDILAFVKTVNAKATVYKLLPNCVAEIREYSQGLETFQYANYIIGVARNPKGIV